MKDKNLYKIVLTGGPCAGKTTALARIEEMLTEQGYHVFVVSESATELIKGGIKPFGDNAINIVDFQELILNYQLSKERIYESASLLNSSSKNVIIYDRGLLDNKAYINQEIFDKLLSKIGISEIDLMDNYDMVIHLVTSADGKEEFYTLSNNTARTEGIEEAKALDKKTLDAWAGHPNLKIIDNSTMFEEKIQKVLDEIKALIGLNTETKYQRKYLIDIDSSDLSFLTDDVSTKIDIEQHYLESDTSHEKRLRKRTIKGHSTYYFQTEKKNGDGSSIIITDKKISEKDYYKLLTDYKVIGSLTKTRYSFSMDKIYMTLDIYPGNLALLEVNGINKKVVLPDNIFVIKEVTGIKEFDNSHIASKVIKLTK